MALVSGQTLIKALKAPSDPPQVGGKHKIEIAREAWENAAFDVLNKAELLADWIFSALTKSKANDSSTVWALKDDDYWLLLESLVSAKPRALTVVVARYSLSSLAVAVLSAAPSCSIYAIRCLQRIWALAAFRMGVEDIFAVYVACLALDGKMDDHTAKFATTVSTTFIETLETLETSPLKKKILGAFVDQHCPQWALFHRRGKVSSDVITESRERLFEGGCAILFGVDILKASVASGGASHNSILPVLQSLPTALAIDSAASIFGAFARSVRVNKTALLPSSSQGNSIAVAKDVRAVCFASFLDIWNFIALHVESYGAKGWEARRDLLQIVEMDSIYDSSDHLASADRCMQQSMYDAIQKCSDGPSASIAVEILVILGRIDFDIMSSQVPQILDIILKFGARNQATDGLLDLCIDYYSKTRTLPEYLALLFDAINSSATTLTKLGSVKLAYATMSRSSIISNRHEKALKRHIRTNMTPSQVLTTAELVHSIMSQLLVSGGSDDPNLETSAALYQASWLSGHVLECNPLQTADPESRRSAEEIVTEIWGKATQFVAEALKTLRLKGQKEITYSRLLSTAATLQFVLSDSCHRELTVDLKSLTRSINSGIMAQLPELRVHMIRAALRLISQERYATDDDAIKTVFDNIFQCIQAHSDSASVCGTYYELTEEDLGPVVANLLLDRHLSDLENCRNSLHRDALAKLIVNGQVDQNGFSSPLKQVITTALSSAQFWEMRNIRNSIVQLLAEHLSSEFESASNLAGSLFFLLASPVEYIPSQQRSLFLRKAIQTDEETSGRDWQTLLLCRTYVKRVVTLTKADEANLPRSYLDHLLKVYDPDSGMKNLQATTLDVIELALRVHQKLDMQNLLQAVETGTRDIRTLFVSLLTNELAPAELTSQDLHAISSFRNRVFASLSINATTDSNFLLDWHSVLLLDRWAPEPGYQTQHRLSSLAADILQAVLQKKFIGGNLALALEIIALEHDLDNLQSAFERTEFLMTGYIAVSASCLDRDQSQVDKVMQQVTSKSSAERFQTMLDFCYEALRSGPAGVVGISHILHAASLLVTNIPQGVSKKVSDFTTKILLEMSVSDDVLFGDEIVLQKVLGHLQYQTTNRSAALKPVDLGNILAILNNILQSSTEHASHTSFQIFHLVNEVLNALVRLRRDLVVHNLPHLGLILSRLLSLIRQARPSLGRKQQRSVADILPNWLSIEEPLGVAECKSLSRLLSTLTLKTVVRSHQVDLDKAQSLAKPFSKHAIYVLKGYVDVITDELCVLPADCRRELQPGLFSLCEIIPEHSRDALMASALDSSGKAVMKALWADFEKQRYVGRG